MSACQTLSAKTERKTQIYILRTNLQDYPIVLPCICQIYPDTKAEFVEFQGGVEQYFRYFF